MVSEELALASSLAKPGALWEPENFAFRISSTLETRLLCYLPIKTGLLCCSISLFLSPIFSWLSVSASPAPSFSASLIVLFFISILNCLPTFPLQLHSLFIPPLPLDYAHICKHLNLRLGVFGVCFLLRCQLHNSTALIPIITSGKEPANMPLEWKKIALDKPLAAFLWSAMPTLDLLQDWTFSKLNLLGMLTKYDLIDFTFFFPLICFLSVYAMPKKVHKSTKDLSWSKRVCPKLVSDEMNGFYLIKHWQIIRNGLLYKLTQGGCIPAPDWTFGKTVCLRFEEAGAGGCSLAQNTVENTCQTVSRAR